jgi:hypothetical protein
MDNTNELRIGLDFGGVIVANHKAVPGEDTGLASSGHGQAAMPGAIHAVRELISLSGGQVWIISKAGPRMQARTLEWLEGTGFHGQTGLPVENVRFCLERTDKAELCRELGITHFVDDRVHVMQILRHVVPALFMFGDLGGERFCPPWAIYVSDWWTLAERVRARRGSDDGC